MNITRKTILLSIFSTFSVLFAFSQADFITVWNTTLAGEADPANRQIVFPGIGTNYNLKWEEVGNAANKGSLTGVSGTQTLSFSRAGTYKLTASNGAGAFTGFKMWDASSGVDNNQQKLTTVQQWGNTITWTSLSNGFQNCSNMDVTATDTPIFGSSISLSDLFANCSSLVNNNGSFANWNTTNVTDMSGMFIGASVFNQPIGNWNTANVTNMNSMFYNARAFNQPIGNWNTANVTDMGYMFTDASTFNQPIDNWNTAKVTNMSHLFHGASAFNQPIGNWNTSNVTRMVAMFTDASAFNQPIGNWNTSNVTNMMDMFGGASVFNQPIGNWNTANVTDMAFMFSMASSFNQSISSWNTAKVTDMSGMFIGASVFNQSISSWNTAKVTDMSAMFGGASVFNQSISSWNTAKVADMSYMFAYASAFNQQIGNLDLSSVANMGDMLTSSGMDCPTYTSTLIGWANSATTPSNMLLGATGLTYGSSAVAARNTLIAKGWTITGDAAGSCLPLPVLFGNVSAVLKNGELFISWTTLTESNSDHFAIEVSKDGKTFTTVKSVISKATNEVSDHRIDYDVAIPISNSSLAWIFLPTAFGAALLTNRKRVKILILLSVLGISFFVNSCSKKDSQNTVNASHNFWVRIVQVDKSGNTEYSKVVKVREE